MLNGQEKIFIRCWWVRDHFERPVRTLDEAVKNIAPFSKLSVNEIREKLLAGERVTTPNACWQRAGV